MSTARVPFPIKDRWTNAGKAGAVVAVIMILSTDVAYRIPVGPLLMHPYLLLAPVVAVAVSLPLLRVPQRILIPALVFLGYFSIGLLLDQEGLPEIVKLAASIFTFLFFVQVVRTPTDYQRVGLALLIVAVYVTSLTVFKAGTGGLNRLDGINALEGLGNKNAQSLFFLPGLFYGIHEILNAYRKKSWVWLSMLTGACAIILVGALLAASRSGWLAVAFVILWAGYRLGISIRTLVMIGLFAGIAYIGIQQYASDIVDHKVEQTVEGYDSDEKRQNLIIQSVLIGLRNPVFGLGHIGLQKALAKRVKSYGSEVIDPHNVYGYLLGAGGVITFISFFVLLSNLRRRMPAPSRFHRFAVPYVQESHHLILGFILVFLLRAFFTRELLYSPTTMAMLGLLYANLQLHYRWAQWAFKEHQKTTSEENQPAQTRLAS